MDDAMEGAMEDPWQVRRGSTEGGGPWRIDDNAMEGPWGVHAASMAGPWGVFGGSMEGPWRVYGVP